MINYDREWYFWAEISLSSIRTAWCMAWHMAWTESTWFGSRSWISGRRSGVSGEVGIARSQNIETVAVKQIPSLPGWRPTYRDAEDNTITSPSCSIEMIFLTLKLTVWLRKGRSHGIFGLPVVGGWILGHNYVHHHWPCWCGGSDNSPHSLWDWSEPKRCREVPIPSLPGWRPTDGDAEDNTITSRSPSCLIEMILLTLKISAT
jgi:hypothetical protein